MKITHLNRTVSLKEATGCRDKSLLIKAFPSKCITSAIYSQPYNSTRILIRSAHRVGLILIH